MVVVGGRQYDERRIIIVCNVLMVLIYIKCLLSVMFSCLVWFISFSTPETWKILFIFVVYVLIYIRFVLEMRWWWWWWCCSVEMRERRWKTSEVVVVCAAHKWNKTLDAILTVLYVSVIGILIYKKYKMYTELTVYK